MKTYELIKDELNRHGYDSVYFTEMFYKTYVCYIGYRQMLRLNGIFNYDEMLEEPIKNFSFYYKTHDSYVFFQSILYKYDIFSEN